MMFKHGPTIRVVLATTRFVVHLSQRTVSIRKLFNPAAATRYIKSVRENLTMHCISIFFYIKSENDTLEVLKIKIANLLSVVCEKKYSIIIYIRTFKRMRVVRMLKYILFSHSSFGDNLAVSEDLTANQVIITSKLRAGRYLNSNAIIFLGRSSPIMGMQELRKR